MYVHKTIDLDPRTSGWALESLSRCIAYWNQSNNTSERPLLGHFRCMFQKPHIPDTSGCPKNIRFRCIQKKNTSELHKSRQSRCIHSSKSINLSNPRCHIIPSEAHLRANHSETHRNSIKIGNSDVSKASETLVAL